MRSGGPSPAARFTVMDDQRCTLASPPPWPEPVALPLAPARGVDTEPVPAAEPEASPLVDIGSSGFGSAALAGAAGCGARQHRRCGQRIRRRRVGRLGRRRFADVAGLRGRLTGLAGGLCRAVQRAGAARLHVGPRGLEHLAGGTGRPVLHTARRRLGAIERAIGGVAGAFLDAARESAGPVEGALRIERTTQRTVAHEAATGVAAIAQRPAQRAAQPAPRIAREPAETLRRRRHRADCERADDHGVDEKIFVIPVTHVRLLTL